MKQQYTYKIIISLLITLVCFNPLFSQSEDKAIIGKVVDESGEALIGVSILIESPTTEIIGTITDFDGNFSLPTPFGKHKLQVKYIGYEDCFKEINHQLSDTAKIVITMNCGGPPLWNNILPFDEIGGSWKPTLYTKGNEMIDLSKKADGLAINFSNIENGAPGILSWNDGCSGCSGLYFRKVNDDTIEVYEPSMIDCTAHVLACGRNEELALFIEKMPTNNSKFTFSDDGLTLELFIGNERLKLTKTRNNVFPEYSSELLGNWQPIKGKFGKKEIRKFNKNAFITIVSRYLVVNGKIKYTEINVPGFGNRMYLPSKIEDDKLRDYQFRQKVGVPKKKDILGALLQQFTKRGYEIEFNETKDIVTLKFENDFVTLKKIL